MYLTHNIGSASALQEGNTIIGSASALPIIQTEITNVFFCVCVSVCLCLPFANHERSALPSATKNKKIDEKEKLRGKNWRALRQLLVFGPNAILVCGPKAIFTLFFPLLLVVHRTSAGEKEVERAQDSHAFQMGALVVRFERSETLRVSSPFLSKSLKKALLYRCEKAKVNTCMATESKQIPGLVMAKLCLSASCSELLLSSFVWQARLHMAGRKQRSLFLWTAAESESMSSIEKITAKNETRDR